MIVIVGVTITAGVAAATAEGQLLPLMWMSVARSCVLLFVWLIVFVLAARSVAKKIIHFADGSSKGIVTFLYLKRTCTAFLALYKT